MRAALLEENNKPLSIVDDVEIEDPRVGEVVVKISNCGICHSDLTVIDSPGDVQPVGGGMAALARREAFSLPARIDMSYPRVPACCPLAFEKLRRSTASTSTPYTQIWPDPTGGRQCRYPPADGVASSVHLRVGVQ